MTNQQPQPPRALTKDQIAIVSRHASERAELEALQHNERVALQERQRSELAVAMGVDVPPLPMRAPQ